MLHPLITLFHILSGGHFDDHLTTCAEGVEQINIPINAQL